MLFATGWRIFPASGRDISHQTDLPRVDFQPPDRQACHRTAVHHSPAAQQAFKRVSPQELLTHLRVAHLRHRRRFIHPQRAVDQWQLFSTHPVGQKAKVAHHPEKLLRDVLFQPRHDVPLRQRLCGLLTGIVVVVAEAQRGTACVVRQPGARYRWFFR